MVLEDNPNKVGVRFDKPVYGGNNLVDLCEDGHGFFCNGILSTPTFCSFKRSFCYVCHEVISDLIETDATFDLLRNLIGRLVRKRFAIGRGEEDCSMRQHGSAVLRDMLGACLTAGNNSLMQ